MNYNNNKIWRKEKKSKHKYQIQEATKEIINKAENNKTLQNVIKLIPVFNIWSSNKNIPSTSQIWKDITFSARQQRELRNIMGEPQNLIFHVLKFEQIKLME
jgi:hypothetical protein